MKDEYKDLYQQFGLNVVYYRKKLRLSQTQLAELANIHRTYVSSIELGKVSVSFDIVFKLAEIFEITPNKLFEFKERTKLQKKGIRKVFHQQEVSSRN